MGHGQTVQTQMRRRIMRRPLESMNTHPCFPIFFTMSSDFYVFLFAYLGDSVLPKKSSLIGKNLLSKGKFCLLRAYLTCAKMKFAPPDSVTPNVRRIHRTSYCSYARPAQPGPFR